MELSPEYIVELFFTHCKRPIHKKYNNIYNAECPVCKEGKSNGRTRRLFYFPLKQYFYCHNCLKSWKPLEWAKEVTGMSVPEIYRINRQKSQQPVDKKPIKIFQSQKPLVLSDLPENCIDLTDNMQLNFYKNNKVVSIASSYCNDRRLFSAVNSCDKFYVSLEDKVHKNRLIIPFYDESKKVVCYQSRSLFKTQTPKYLTKLGDKSVFNITNIDSSIPYIFVFEGPIDSMFVKNGVAIASLAPTQKQRTQLQSLIGYQLVYVLDNDKNNKQAQKRIEKHIKDGYHIFIWPKELNKFKDFNEVCCKLQIDEIPWKFVVKNSAYGNEAMLKYKLSLTHCRSSNLRQGA